MFRSTSAASLLARFAFAGAGLWLVSGPGCGGRAALKKPADLARMVRVPAGEFVMGRDSGDVDERPVRRVWLDEFYIDRHEVTNAQFRAFCDATGRLYPPNPEWDLEYFGTKPDHPVVKITWDQASTYCAWAGKRLPTEAEWEKAARGTDGRLYPWGNDWVEGRANLARHDAFDRAAPVGSFPDGASVYGALDMAGNVWEWCADWFDDAYYANSPLRNPPGPPGPKAFRAVRGGCFSNPQKDAVVTNRSKNEPSRVIYHLGCRCAWSATPPAAPAENPRP